MIDQHHLKEFIQSNDKQTLVDYKEKLYNNLKEIIASEEKQTLILLIILVLYFFVDYKSLSNISLGVITITNTANLVVQILPIIFCGLLFNLNSIGKQRQDLQETLWEISSVLSNNLVKEELKKELLDNSLFRLYLPNSIANFTSNVKTEKHITINFIGLILLLPFLVIGLLPFLIIILMLCNLWQTQIETIPGIISFSVTFWISISIIYFFFIPEKKKKF